MRKNKYKYKLALITIKYYIAMRYLLGDSDEGREFIKEILAYIEDVEEYYNIDYK